VSFLGRGSGKDKTSLLLSNFQPPNSVKCPAIKVPLIEISSPKDIKPQEKQESMSMKMTILSITSLLFILAIAGEWQLQLSKCIIHTYFCCSVSAVEQEDVFEAGQTYILLADNNLFVGRINRGSINTMEAVKQSIDPFTLLRASVLGNGKISLRADDGNQLYLSRITRNGIENIEAAKQAIDVFSEFAVEVDASGPWNGAHYVYLRADTGQFIGIVNRNGRNNIEASFSERTNAARFIVLEAE
jgi:hypothetical protein